MDQQSLIRQNILNDSEKKQGRPNWVALVHHT